MRKECKNSNTRKIYYGIFTEHPKIITQRLRIQRRLHAIYAF